MSREKERKGEKGPNAEKLLDFAFRMCDGSKEKAKAGGRRRRRAGKVRFLRNEPSQAVIFNELIFLCDQTQTILPFQ